MKKGSMSQKILNDIVVIESAIRIKEINGKKLSETFSRSFKYLVAEIFSISIILILLFHVIVISYTKSF